MKEDLISELGADPSRPAGRLCAVSVAYFVLC